jgi:hypothetical protein
LSLGGVDHLVIHCVTEVYLHTHENTPFESR